MHHVLERKISAIVGLVGDVLARLGRDPQKGVLGNVAQPGIVQQEVDLDR